MSIGTGITDKRMVFLAALAKQVAPLTADDAGKAMIPLLAGVAHIPEGVFSDPMALATRLALELERIPNAAKLRKMLETEAGRLKPVELLPYPEEPGLSDDDRLWIKHWQDNRNRRSVPRASSLDVIRQKAPAAYEVLCRDDDEAADIVVRNKWSSVATSRRLSDQLRLEWGDTERVRLSVMKIALCESPAVRFRLASALRAALTKHAPDNLWLLDSLDAEPVPAAERLPFPPVAVPTPAPAPVSASGIDWG